MQEGEGSTLSPSERGCLPCNKSTTEPIAHGRFQSGRISNWRGECLGSFFAPLLRSCERASCVGRLRSADSSASVLNQQLICILAADVSWRQHQTRTWNVIKIKGSRYIWLLQPNYSCVFIIKIAYFLFGIGGRRVLWSTWTTRPHLLILISCFIFVTILWASFYIFYFFTFLFFWIESNWIESNALR